MTPEEQEPATSQELGRARQQLGLSVPQLWMAYFGVGGNASLDEVGRWVSGTAEIPRRDHNYLAQALNDSFTELGEDHPVRYRPLA